MKKSLVIYDFAPVPSEFPNTRGKFYYLFTNVGLSYRPAILCSLTDRYATTLCP
jgi:hypothetical protein